MAVVSDPIADLLTCIRNAGQAQLRYVEVRGSKLKVAILEVLRDLGYIESFLVKDGDQGRKIRVFLKYDRSRRHVIKGIQRVSTPGRRFYIGCEQIPRVLGGMGAAILSTPRGVMTGQRAVRDRVGGELLCKVW